MAEEGDETSRKSFASLANLDTRILRALADQTFVKPTLVQAKAIPIALEGKDILCRARTGSGKTVAYCVPILERVLAGRNVTGAGTNIQATRALILVPTRELAEQVTGQMKKLAKYCEDVLVANVAGSGTSHLNKMQLSDSPDVVIGTPARILSLLQSKALDLQSLEILVIDEADLILSYGHAQTMNTLLSSTSTSTATPADSASAKQKKGSYLPSVFQSLLMSATLTADVTVLKSLVLRNPAILTLTEGDDEESKSLLSQYVLHLPTEADKFLYIYVILKLKLIKGKAILFVNDVERCYRLKLFLEQFSIRACVLNRELPINSRYHTIEEFNKGIYEYIIATDESGGRNEEFDSDSEEEADDVVDDDAESFAQTQRAIVATDGEGDPSSPKKRKLSEVEDDDVEMDDNSVPKKRQKVKRDQDKKKPAKGEEKEYSTSRGVDFVNVACVVNFDLPLSSRSYVHRVGRTARAGRGGVAISFVVSRPGDKSKMKGSEGEKVIADEEKIWTKIEREQNGWTKQVFKLPPEDRPESIIKPFNLSPSLLSGFRYRMQDAYRSVTGKAVKEARIKELKNEVLNSGKLKAHFEDHPMDLEYLRHDKPLHPTRVQTHMKYVPSYLLPKNMTLAGKVDSTGGEQTGQFDGAIAAGVIGKEMSANVGFVPFNKRGQHRGRGRGRGTNSRHHHGSGRKKNDPLKKFSV
ncbi:DEAD-domain-containing protein [Serendipita vermifera]|nr:DEAD-domain-containing protein [Serendipita vermifera]